MDHWNHASVVLSISRFVYRHNTGFTTPILVIVIVKNHVFNYNYKIEFSMNANDYGCEKIFKTLLFLQETTFMFSLMN
jgi:hypothetical protein